MKMPRDMKRRAERIIASREPVKRFAIVCCDRQGGPSVEKLGAGNWRILSTCEEEENELIAQVLLESEGYTDVIRIVPVGVDGIWTKEA